MSELINNPSFLTVDNYDVHTNDVFSIIGNMSHNSGGGL